ncbi:MAG: DNA replication and repair protein RecF [Saprospiraceae bacterium]|nr:DNA replication and repair protein RecF [Saprospiraceae bacterium]
MHLKQLRLINFKNYRDEIIDFSQEINCIVGDNGSGKTNLLDAIHYLSMTKSAFNSIDSQNIKNGDAFFSIIGKYTQSGKSHDLFCSQERGKKKVFRLDNDEYEKLSEHVGKFPCVLISPNDTDLIREGSEIRRRFFDSIISQADQQYLKDLIDYTHNLKQRNHLLRYFQNQLDIDHDLLEPYNKVLLDKGLKLYEKRKDLTNQFIPLFIEKYSDLSSEKEIVSINYSSQFDKDNHIELFNKSLAFDLDTQRTTFGIHRDKWDFFIEDKPLKKFGSQGQQKTFVISLKLAQFELLYREKGFCPVLLLDDIFDKLDDHRIEKLMDMVAKDQFSQIFLTDARPERTKTILSSLNLNSNLVTIDEGRQVK